MAGNEPTPDENLLLLEEIEANRAFILLAYQSDATLLELADPQIRRLFGNADEANAGIVFKHRGDEDTQIILIDSD